MVGGLKRPLEFAAGHADVDIIMQHLVQFLQQGNKDSWCESSSLLHAQGNKEHLFFADVCSQSMVLNIEVSGFVSQPPWSSMDRERLSET